MSPLKTSLHIKTFAAFLFINYIGSPLTKLESEKHI